MQEFSSQIISDFADKANFDAFGICKAVEVGKMYADKFLDWVNSSKVGNLDYMKRYAQIRFNPKLLLEDAKSVICFRANFKRPIKEKRIATYAQSKDYHLVLREKLAILDKTLQDLGGKQKICIDTVPIMEKYFAQKCGLGYIGKNTLLISDGNGPFNFLAIMLSTLNFEEYGTALEEDCKDCNLCVQSCPTKALSAYSLDASKCISALTIEEGKEVTINGNQFIFGCDICLRVCPKGRANSIPRIKEFCNCFDILDKDAKLKNLYALGKDTPMQRTINKLLKDNK